MAPKGLAYLKSLPSVLKFLEFVILLVAIGTVGYFMDKLTGDYKKKGNLEFFMFVVAAGWILVLGLFILFISGLREKCSSINWSLSVAIISALLSLLLLISSALLADAVHYYDKIMFCEKLDTLKADARCKQLVGGTVCGFIAMFIFMIDTFLHSRIYMAGEGSPRGSV